MRKYWVPSTVVRVLVRLMNMACVYHVVLRAGIPFLSGYGTTID